MFGFWHAASPEARRALIAASLGWLLDAFDVMLYALVLASLMSDLGMDRTTGGLLGSLTLAASAAGGAALVSETWPAEHRGKALGLMQSCWAIGYGAAAFVTGLILPRYGWRAVFLVGVLPALFTLWIRRHVQEPAVWQRAQAQTSGALQNLRLA